MKTIIGNVPRYENRVFQRLPNGYIISQKGVPLVFVYPQTQSRLSQTLQVSGKERFDFVVRVELYEVEENQEEGIGLIHQQLYTDPLNSGFTEDHPLLISIGQPLFYEEDETTITPLDFSFNFRHSNNNPFEL